MELANRILQAGASDEPHGIKGTPILEMSQTVDRGDSPVLERPGDLGFVNEADLALGIIG